MQKEQQNVFTSAGEDGESSIKGRRRSREIMSRAATPEPVKKKRRKRKVHGQHYKRGKQNRLREQYQPVWQQPVLADGSTVRDIPIISEGIKRASQCIFHNSESLPVFYF